MASRAAASFEATEGALGAWQSTRSWPQLGMMGGIRQSRRWFSPPVRCGSEGGAKSNAAKPVPSPRRCHPRNSLRVSTGCSFRVSLPAFSASCEDMRFQNSLSWGLWCWGSRSSRCSQYLPAMYKNIRRASQSSLTLPIPPLTSSRSWGETVQLVKY